MPDLNVRELEDRDISDRVRLHRARAMGVYGYIFDGELLSLGRPIGSCAVKLVETRERYPAEGFLQDLREQAKWAHPRLLSVHTSGVIKYGPGAGWIFLAMELAEFSLQEVLDGGDRLPQRDVQEMLVHISEALVYLHENGLCHGEIRPCNVLYTKQGWKLSGLEYRGALGRRLEEQGPSENFFVFRAPEALENLPESPAADIWSFGVLAHAALTSRLPFEETTELTRGDLLWRICNRDPEPEAAGEPFDSLLDGCLKREPAERWSARKTHLCLKGEEEAPSPVASATIESSVASVQSTSSPRDSSSGWSLLRWWPLIPAALVGVGVFLGLTMTPRKPKMRPNVLSNQLTTMSFQVGHLDSRGRLAVQSARAPGIKQELGNGVVLDLVQIPAGEFDMGSPADEPQRDSDEGPRHRVKIDAFYMCRGEITQAQWAQVAAFPPYEIALPAEPSQFVGGLQPVENISYPEAIEFCRRLTQKSRRVFRLATEAEWEYACRGGPSNQPFHFGSCLTEQVATFDGSRSYLEAVSGSQASRPTAWGKHTASNPWGLIDMHGNLKEWCQDFYGPYGDERQFNPEGPAEGADRVLRGGSFRSFAWKCRSAARAHASPEERSVDVGLRVVAPEMVPVNGGS